MSAVVEETQAFVPAPDERPSVDSSDKVEEAALEDLELKSSVTRVLTSTRHQGAQLAFRDLTVEVPIKKNLPLGLSKNTGEYKKILNDVSGIFEPGNLVFIMGPSGSGKSTLLDTLADRMGQRMSGTVYLNRELKDEALFKRISKYVQQEDHLFEMITTKECLSFAYDLYRGRDDKAKKEERIQSILAVMGLTEQADVRAGGMLFKGLSGGQQRRLSVAETLVAMPQIMFLDEITSGLDAASSYYVMKSLKHIAHANNMVIIATIHQPSEDIFEFSDKLLLLSSGQMAYFGPTANVKSHMLGLGLQMPADMSLADWLLFCINSDFEDALESKNIVLEGWRNSEAAQNLYRELDELELDYEKKHEAEMHAASQMSISAKSVGMVSSKLGDLRETALGDSGHGSSWWTQVRVLTHRSFYNLLRDPTIIWMRLMMYTSLAIVIGTVWLQLDLVATAEFDYICALAFTCGFFVFMVIAVVPAQFAEKAVVLKEKNNYAYTVSAYSLSRFLVDLPFLSIMSLICCSIVYWLVGFTADAGKFFYFVLTFFCGFLAAESFAFFVSATTPHYLLAILNIAFAFGGFMTVMGVMIRLDEITWALRWMQYISIQFYIFMSLAVNEFSDITFAATPDSTPPLGEITGQEVLEVLGIAGWNQWIGVGALLAMVVVYRSLATLWMYKMYTGKK